MTKSTPRQIIQICFNTLETMVFSTVTFVGLLTVLAVSAKPQSRIFSHKGVGYSVLNHTVQPLSATCSVTSVTQVASAVASCTKINVGSFSVPVAYQPLIFRLQAGTTLTFTGQLTFQKNAFRGYLIQIIGDNVLVQGTETNKFHGHGELYWDTKGGNNGSVKPTFFYLKGQGSTFTGFSIKNCPMRCVAIDSSRDIKVSGFLIDNREGAPGTAPPNKEGHNTDGFDVSKTQYLTLENHAVYNQDDCVAVNSGAHMVIDNFYCDGSHGFDIATGLDLEDRNRNIVNNITFQNSNLTNGMYGLHILTCSDGGKGYVTNIKYNNIHFNGPSDYGIMIQQDFSNIHQKSTRQPTGNVPISNVHFTGVYGTVKGEHSAALIVRCAKNACSNMVFKGVSITGAKSKNECMNYPFSGWC